MLVGMAESYLPKLAAQQTQAHNAWNRTNTIEAYTDLLVSETGADPLELLELADPTTSPLDEDDHRAVLADALGIQLNSGVTALYDAISPDKSTTADFMSIGFDAEQATNLAAAKSNFDIKQTREFSEKRIQTEQTILNGVDRKTHV